MLLEIHCYLSNLSVFYIKSVKVRAFKENIWSKMDEAKNRQYILFGF